MIKLEKCFGENQDGECKVLYTDECDKYACPFYKSEMKAKQDYAKAERRCMSVGIPSNNNYVIWKKAKDMVDTTKSLYQLP